MIGDPETWQPKCKYIYTECPECWTSVSASEPRELAELRALAEKQGKRIKALERLIVECHNQEEQYHSLIANNIEELRQILMDPIWREREGEQHHGPAG